MKVFLDASVLVEACLLHSRYYAAADRLTREPQSCTSSHALAEAYATLSGDKRLGINPHDAARMVRDVSESLQVESLDANPVRELIAAAPAHGIYGGTIYDAIHAETARALGCQRVYTLNLSHFRHAASDLEVLAL